MDKVSIVVPTYNEGDNIQALIKEIDAVMKTVSAPYELLVVDDDSPDRTWELADELSDEFPVTVIRRRGRRGLSDAVVRGFQESDGKYLVVMDADFQHPPSSLPDLIEPLLEGEDFVVASRFLPGSEIKEFGWLRTLVAYCSNSLARLVLKEIRPVEDVLAGFFAFRRSVLPAEYPQPFGYKILLTLLVHGNYETVREVPYTFDKRRAGQSKLGLKNIYWFLRHLIRLYTSSR